MGGSVCAGGQRGVWGSAWGRCWEGVQPPLLSLVTPRGVVAMGLLTRLGGGGACAAPHVPEIAACA